MSNDDGCKRMIDVVLSLSFSQAGPVQFQDRFTVTKSRLGLINEADTGIRGFFKGMNVKNRRVGRGGRVSERVVVWLWGQVEYVSSKRCMHTFDTFDKGNKASRRKWLPWYLLWER
jgi:hypothetical protein